MRWWHSIAIAFSAAGSTLVSRLDKAHVEFLALKDVYGMELASSLASLYFSRMADSYSATDSLQVMKCLDGYCFDSI